MNTILLKVDEKLSDIATVCLNRENRSVLRTSVSVLIGLIIVLIFIGALSIRFRLMDPVQRYYLKQYLASGIQIGMLSGKFTTLYLVNAENSVVPDEVMKTGTLIKPGDLTWINVNTSRISVRLADHLTGTVVAVPVKMKVGDRNLLLKTQIYHHKTLLELFEVELWVVLGTLVFLIPIPFLIHVPKPKSGDRKWVSGVKPVTVPGFVREVKGDGYCLRVRDNTQKHDFVVRKVFEQTLAINHLLGSGQLSQAEKKHLTRAGKKDKIWNLRVQLDDEGKPLIISGDTGSGKSQALIQLLLNALRRNETAIVYDPEGIYTQYFFDQARGDIIINPYDQRSPQWNLCDEIATGDGSTIAESIISIGKANSNDWFFDKAKKITDFILKRKFDNQTLIELFSNIEKLRELVKGTEFEEILSAKAPEQASGVVSTMSNIATYLRLFNPKASTWSSSNWTYNRKGWIFINPQQNQQEALRGLNTAILDLLITRILQLSKEDSVDKPVWFIVDELASLKHFPKLMTLMLEGRKHNCRTVLGFQGYKQLKDFYGEAILTGLAQAFFQIHLRTKEPYDAEYKSRMISKMLVQKTQVTESRNHKDEKSTSISTTEEWELTINDGVIATLQDLEAVLIYGNFSTRAKLVYTPLPIKHAPFVLRKDLISEGGKPMGGNQPNPEPSIPGKENVSITQSTKKPDEVDQLTHDLSTRSSERTENGKVEIEDGVVPFISPNLDQGGSLEGFYRRRGQADNQFYKGMERMQEDLIALTRQLSRQPDVRETAEEAVAETKKDKFDLKSDAQLSEPDQSHQSRIEENTNQYNKVIKEMQEDLSPLTYQVSRQPDVRETAEEAVAETKKDKFDLKSIDSPNSSTRKTNRKKMIARRISL